MFYVAMGKIDKGTAPIGPKGPDGLYENVQFSNPVPHVLMLTAIVVGVATTALALSLVLRINEDYGTAEEDEIDQLEEVHIMINHFRFSWWLCL